MRGPMKILEMSTESSMQVAFVLPIAQHLRKQGSHVELACSELQKVCKPQNASIRGIP